MSANQAGVGYLDEELSGIALVAFCLLAGIVSWTVPFLLLYGASVALATVLGFSDQIFVVSSLIRANGTAVASVLGLLSVGTAAAMVFVANGTR